MLVAVPLVAAPVITAFLLVGGAAEQPGRPTAGTTVVTRDAACGADVSCPQGFARPLEC
jgi:hypothetical protein